MSNYSVLKQDINNNIYENQTQQITGTVLNAILNEMTASLGAGYQFAGVATLGMNPGDPDQRVFYLAGEGVYTNFGGLQVPAGKLGVLKWDFRWTLQTIDGLGGGGANLTGYVSLASTDDLPEEGQPTLGYLCGTNLYLYVGTGGDTKEGKYQNCGSFRGPQGLQGDPGVGIASVTQTTTSTEDEGINVITVTKEDGTQSTFQVRNGSKGSQGIQGPQGVQGEPGRLQAQYKEVETLPTASADTVDYIYLVASQTPDVYDMYYTEENQGAYSWKSLGTTAVQLSDYATKAEVTELEHKVDEKFHAPDTEVGTFDDGYYNTNADTLPANRNTLSGCKSAKISVTPGQLYKIYGEALNNNYYRFYAFYDSDGNRIDRYSSSGTYRDTPLDVTVPANAVTMVVNLGNYASATDKVIIPGEEYSFQDFDQRIEQASEDVAGLSADVSALETKTDTLESTIIEGASITLKGISTSNLVLNEAIELTQDGDEVEVKVADIDANSDWFSFSNSGVSSNSYYAIALGRASIDIRATDGEWICGTTSIPYADKHTIKIVYSSGNIYTYVDGSLVHTRTGQKTIRISSFGNGGNGTYGYWKGTIVSIKHNTANIALYEQQANDATVAYVYRFVKWSDISGLDVLPVGVLKYDSTNKVFDFFNRYGKTDKYFSFRVRLNENNSDLVYLKEWRLSEGKVWSYTGENFTEIAQTIYDAENEMAMRFVNTVDYTGGIHGDERIDVSPLSFVRFFADGRLITDAEMQNDFTIECSSFCYMQMSTLHETSATAETFVAGHPIVAYHYKRNTFEDCASRLENVIKFASQQTVTQYHAGMMCVGKGAGLYAVLPGMVSTPELSGTNDDYDADDFAASRVDMWNPTTGVRCFVEGVLTQGIENTDIQQFEVWDRTTDSKYYRRMVKGDSVAPVFEAGEFIRNEQTIKFY